MSTSSLFFCCFGISKTSAVLLRAAVWAMVSLKFVFEMLWILDELYLKRVTIEVAVLCLAKIEVCNNSKAPVPSEYCDLNPACLTQDRLTLRAMMVINGVHPV